MRQRAWQLIKLGSLRIYRAGEHTMNETSRRYPNLRPLLIYLAAASAGILVILAAAHLPLVGHAAFVLIVPFGIFLTGLAWAWMYQSD